MSVNPTDPAPHQVMVLHESQHVLVINHRRAGKGSEGFQDDFATP
jgi:hypothetical protein